MKNPRIFRLLAFGLFLLVVAAYSNHFNNSFHFDDFHCITSNAYIRSLHNIPKFFKSGKTFSALPLNQSYRPLLTALYALDYHFGGFNVLYYHIPIFLFFLLQGMLMYLLIVKLFGASYPHPNNPYFALLATGWYMVNTANADTINYISSSSDSISTFWVVAGLVAYMYIPGRLRYLLCSAFAIIAVLFKQSALVFPGLLAVYIFLYEAKEDNMVQKIAHTLRVSLPALLVCGALYFLQAKLTPSTFVPGGKPLPYIISQPYVMLHYFESFFLPISLTADSDWVPITSMLNMHFIVGMAFVLIMLALAVKLHFNRKYAPISFGIAFFFIALLPTTLLPLAEVMNDHRAFFAYIGIAIASVWALRFLYEKIENSKPIYKKLFQAAMVLVIVCNAISTYARNRVWVTEESLWHDVAIKSPGNGRGIMNYGITLMAKGDYKDAEEYYNRAMQLLPDYAYVYENMAILKAAEKQKDEAEKYFKQAIQYGADIPVMYYYYAKFLHEQGRDKEAEALLKESISLSPGEIDSRYMLMQVYRDEENWPALTAMARQTITMLPADSVAHAYLAIAAGKKTKLEQALDTVKQNPSAENYLNLSLVYYNLKEYDKCIEACNEALKINPVYYFAYNNMGSAYNMMGEWKKAEAAFSKALKLNPGFQLAQNNYNFSRLQDAVTDSMNAVLSKVPTAENYLNLSLMYYKQGLYMKSVNAAVAALKVDSTYALAYNNMCAAYNSMAMWDEAIKAGEQAVRLAPLNQLAKNNLAAARRGKQAQ